MFVLDCVLYKRVYLSVIVVMRDCKYVYFMHVMFNVLCVFSAD